AMRIYTSRLNYLYSVKEGAKRIDADGNETDEVVSAEHALYAQERIKEIKQKRKPAKTAPKKNFDKKNRGQVKKGQGKFQRKPFKVEGIVATVDNAKQGQEVLVLSSEQHFVRGVLAQDAQKDTVRVTLNSGLTVELPLDRILLPKSAK
ncbi:MAG: ProQ/FINO family protein, partial [Succinivibrio sp.]